MALSDYLNPSFTKLSAVNASAFSLLASASFARFPEQYLIGWRMM
jgi:hypothetical protein